MEVPMTEEMFKAYKELQRYRDKYRTSNSGSLLSRRNVQD